MKKYSVSQARAHLSALIRAAESGEVIEITVFEQPYVRMTCEAPQGGMDALLVDTTKARDKWSQLLSTVANDRAAFAFVTGNNIKVYLLPAPEYTNPFITRWESHVEASPSSVSDELQSTLSVLTEVSAKLAALQQRVTTLMETTREALHSEPEREYAPVLELHSTYVILMLFRKDLQFRFTNLTGTDVNLRSFRDTVSDIEQAHRVDFTDIDGTCYTLKAHTLRSGHESIQSITRPDSYEHFKITLPRF